MASTGEVACYGENRYEAYLKAILSAGFKIPRKSALISGDIKPELAPTLQKLITLGLELQATPEAAAALTKAKVPFKALALQAAHKEFRAKSIDLVINIPFHADKSDDMRLLRRAAIDFAVPIITNHQLAEMAIASIEKVGNNFTIKGWDELFPEEHNKQL